MLEDLLICNMFYHSLFLLYTNTDEYKDLKMLETIKLCDRVTVDFPKMNISVKNVPCVKTTYNALMQRYDSIELGTLQTYLSDTIAVQNEDIKDNVSRNEFANVIAKITS